ncbi:Gam-like protein [Leptospira kirschneri str. 200801925]|uniref:Gam-like protein n=1 Tax=Leptospira kirschneri str. 200802841 TaxID=1193047 RepID=A0A828Y0T8_9LEPT|nr:host-nuclease inhibitor Gam family protein [Leptospira kirschneri]EMO76178.1 Gam-like protein [Leptospira kirschneri str. 200801925]EKO49704.1 Gam-like protein [Leptospira kirschneri str. 200802841]EKO50115.1 Gam-like protein [Leptospira kirschneri str. 200802841]EKO53561.1 Gam-like protein [Leptospira kirschneri str. 200802841]EKO53629.1 Gam-like protein [Leptospira kirschneri str. 200802841]
MAKIKKNEEKRPLVDLPSNAYKNKAELEAGMEYMGEQMLERDRLVNEANQKISQIRSELEETVYPIQAKIDHVTSGIAYFVQKNREELFPDPNLKTCKLISGTLNFRKTPASVRTKTSVKLLERILAENGLLQLYNDWIARLSKVFIRAKLELNKDSIIADPLAAHQKIGVELNEEKERLYIKPSRIEDEISADADTEAA